MQHILNLKWVIIAATSVVFAFLISILLNLPLEWISALYGLSLGAAVWMTFRILKDPYTTGKTFDRFFYQDRPDIRCVGKE